MAVSHGLNLADPVVKAAMSDRKAALLLLRRLLDQQVPPAPQHLPPPPSHSTVCSQCDAIAVGRHATSSASS